MTCKGCGAFLEYECTCNELRICGGCCREVEAKTVDENGYCEDCSAVNALNEEDE